MRRLARLCGRLCAVLAVALLLLLAGDRPAAAANFAVTKTADTADGACIPSDCSLREAIIAANASPGADTITLPAAIYILTIAGANEDAAATGDLDITGDLTINGAGAATTIIDGGDLDRVFHVKSGGAVSISGVTIQNGSTVAIASDGGGIRNDGALTLTNSTVSGNTATVAGGIVNYPVGTVTLTNSTVSGNTANFNGGGIFNSGTVTITNSTVSGNTASLANNGGGGIFNQATLTITNSTVSGNTANFSGGGIYNNLGTATITNSTINNNTADSDGNGTGDGGGIARGGGAVNLKNTIVAGNIDPSSDP